MSDEEEINDKIYNSLNEEIKQNEAKQLFKKKKKRRIKGNSIFIDNLKINFFFSTIFLLI